MINLYSDGQPISEIKKAKFSELKFFSEYHDIMQKSYDKAKNKVK